MENDVWKDPIVAEIHAVREQIARECDYDLDKIVERLRARERQHTGRLVSQNPGRSGRIDQPAIKQADQDDAARAAATHVLEPT
jgi:hypothetical protein